MDTNYLLWQVQIKPFFVGQKRWQFIDDTHPCPPQCLPSVDSSKLILNPAYTTWVEMDQTLVGIHIATLSEPVLAQVVGLSTSRKIWDCL